MTAFIKRKSREASRKPKIGERTRDLAMLAACAQSTPLVPERADMS
jgi:hypothetical protein